MPALDYLDLDHWYTLSKDPEIYSWSKAQEAFFDLRMLAVRLKDQTLLIYSPLPLKSEAHFQATEHLGKVSSLLAPNYFHHLGIKPFLNRYGKAHLVATPQAIPRLKAQTSLAFSDCTSLEPLLPEGVRFIYPQGLKTGEVWLAIESKDDNSETLGLDPAAPGNRKILVVCDGFFNMPHHRRGLFGLVLRLTGGAPGLKVSKVFGLIGIKNRPVYRRWIQEFVTSWQPYVLVPSHGDFLTGPQLGAKLLPLV